MSAKLDKLGAEREKALRKRDEWDARYKELDRRYQEQENSEICEVVRSFSLKPEELGDALRRLFADGLPKPEMLEAAEYEAAADKTEEPNDEG